MTVQMIEEVHNPALDKAKQSPQSIDPTAVIADVDPEQLAVVVARLKSSGNEAFQAKRYRGKSHLASPHKAVPLWLQALPYPPLD